MYLVISCCALLFWRKSLDRFHSSAGTTSCPDRGSSPGSRGSTPSTGPPCTCRSEQLGPRSGERESISIQAMTGLHPNPVLNSNCGENDPTAGSAVCIKLKCLLRPNMANLCSLFELITAHTFHITSV